MPASIACLALVVGTWAPAAAARDSVQEVLRDLNGTASVVGSESIKSYPVIFDAYLELEPPPFDVGPDFNASLIYPGMSEWSRVSGWAESNPALADAILACEEKTLFGLPYGAEAVKSEFREAGLIAQIGAEGSLRDNRFPYLRAIDVIAAFATAESYRRLESGRTEEGMNLAVATTFLLRQTCDREFIAEQLHAISLLNDMLGNVRDMFYTYRTKVSADQFAEFAIHKLPFLRPDRGRLLIAEGDKRLAEALIKEVFDARGQPDRDKFPATFASIQSEDKPLTRFGAARRWRMIADVHDSEEASLETLKLVYDDWWRRWRVEAYDPILDVPTQFERTNPIRYAVVIYSLQDIQKLFDARNELLASVYGTAIAAGLCGYRERLGTYPADADSLYATFVRRRSDVDPFDMDFGRFKYRVLDAPFTVSVPEGRLRLEKGEAILYSKGQDHEDNRGAEHTDDGAEGDIVLWPPVKALEREQGLE